MDVNTLLYGGIISLSTAVGLLYKRIEGGLRACEEDRRELWKSLAALQGLGQTHTGSDPRVLSNFIPRP